MRCIILALEGAPVSSVTGPMEILGFAGAMLPDKSLKVSICGESSGTIKGAGGVALMGHGQVEEQSPADVDLVIIGAIGNPAGRQEFAQDTTREWLRACYGEGAHVVSVCTGAFVLAETGLLNGRRATTHWACESQFRERFPDVQLQSECLLTHDGMLSCSGGASAYHDMSLSLVHKYYGPEVARECARTVLIDPDRHSQRQYMSFSPGRQHKDSMVHQLQDWLQEHFAEAFTIADLAEKVNLSERQLKRRFTQATGEAPLTYLQSLRMENGRRLLEATDQGIEVISRACGYEDVRFFRRLFRRATSLSPSEYRARFSLQPLP